MDGDNIAVLYPQVVTDNSVESGTAIIKVIVRKDDQDGVFSLLASNEDCISTEQLELFHSVVRKCDDRVVIVDGISNPRQIS